MSECTKAVKVTLLVSLSDEDVTEEMVQDCMQIGLVMFQNNMKELDSGAKIGIKTEMTDLRMEHIKHILEG